MSSTSETGHAKNVDTFKTIIKYCQGYGASYNPSAENIKLDNLMIQLQAAVDANNDCLKKQTLFDNATDQRMKLFAGLGANATKIMNALMASGAEENTIKSARSIMNKLQGKRVGKIEPNNNPDQTPPNNISVSQRSYVNQVEHLSALIELLLTIPGYQPNETELQTSTLTDYKTKLIEANELTQQSHTDWSNTRITRFNTLYAKQSGVVNTALQIKSYIKSVYGASSPEYKQVSGLQFKTQKA